VWASAKPLSKIARRQKITVPDVVFVEVRLNFIAKI